MCACFHDVSTGSFIPNHANCSMSSRKRKNSSIPEKEGTLSKRARLLSNLWHSQQEAAGSTETSLSNPSSPVYMIKAVIGERPNEYLIDWADDPITGEKFKPDWVSGQSALQITSHWFCHVTWGGLYFLSCIMKLISSGASNLKGT